jgi:hypothetical protein
MEDNTTAPITAPIESTPSVEATPMAMGGVSDSSPQLGWVAIMMLGLTSASLIYSIFYYRRRLESLRKGEGSAITQLKSDMQEMKNKIDKLTGNKVRNGRLA